MLLQYTCCMGGRNSTIYDQLYTCFKIYTVQKQNVIQVNTGKYRKEIEEELKHVRKCIKSTRV